MKRYIKSAIASIKDEDLETQYAIAQDTDDPEILIELSEATDPPIIRAVAENPNTPTPILRHLSKKLTEFIRVGVAKNPSTPSDILYDMVEGLRTDEYGLIEYITINPNTSAEALSLLIKKCLIDEDDFVADLPDFIAENPNTSDDDLVWLLNSGLCSTGTEYLIKARLGKLYASTQD